MRTRPFQEVVDEVIGMHGINPRSGSDEEIANAITRHINQRVRNICQDYRWPEWELTEERAFRPIWSVDRQFVRASTTDGRPDEVFYLGTGFVTGGEFGTDFGYYRVLVDAASDPPIGTLPTDTDFFEAISPVDTFIDYDQTCKRSIGMVLGVYSRNPRVPTGSSNGLLKFKPSEKGVDVWGSGNSTVFVNYKMPTPKYTMIPWVSGKVYERGEVRFDPTVGECFQALAETDTLPSDTTFWRRVPFLEKWSDYVVNESFACSIMEYSQGGQPAMQEKTTLAAYWNEKAEEALAREVNSLIIQGQKWSWSYYKHKWGCWCDSQPWSTGRVSTLTQTCEDELGFIFPTVICAPQVVWQYRHEIEALRAATAEPALDQIGTTLFLPDSLVELVILDEFSVRTRMTFQLLAGTADTGDPNGQVAPLDYDATTNVKYWFRIS